MASNMALSFIVFIFLMALVSVDCQIDGRLEWPVRAGYQPVTEGLFKTYIEMRQTEHENDELIWTLYKCELDKPPVEIAWGREERSLGDKRKFYIGRLDKDNRLLIQVKPKSVHLFSIDQEENEGYELKNYNITEPKYYFVHRNYLFATDRDVFPLKTLWDNKGNATGSQIKYWNLIGNEDDNGLTWKTVRDFCFSKDLFCASNLDVTSNIDPLQIAYRLDVNGIYVAKNFVLYAYCSDHVSNPRCHYYLKDMSGTFFTQWYFPQDLKVSETEAVGVRTMLYPIMDPEDKFFQQSFQDFEPKKRSMSAGEAEAESKAKAGSKSEKDKSFVGPVPLLPPFFFILILMLGVKNVITLL